MEYRELTQNIAIGLASGYAGSKAMTPVTTKLMVWESKQDKEQEKRVSPGTSYNIAAKDLAGRVGIILDKKGAETVGTYFHLGLALTAGEMYVGLRRILGLGPLPSGLITGMVLWVGVDEVLTPAMSWAAPNSAYPLATHMRGLAGHLALGAGVAVAGETLSWLLDRR